MALTYLCRNDYLAGGYCMFSSADPTGKRTAWVSLRNCLYMLPLGLFAYNWGLTSEWFGLQASLLTMGLTIGALPFVLEPSLKTARRMFYGSLLYLPAFMAGLLLHRLMKERDSNAKTGNLLVCNQPITTSSHLRFCNSIPFLTSTYIRVMKTSSGPSYSTGPLGTMCSCIFGFLHEFSAAKGFLGPICC